MKNVLRIVWLMVVWVGGSGVGWGQNAIVGTGFSTNWGGGACPTGNGGFSYLNPSVGGTYIRITTANGTGNQFWRFGIDWGGTTAQRTNINGSNAVVTPNTTYTLDNNCTTNGALQYNVPNITFNYVFKTLNVGTNPTGTWVFFEVQGGVRTISSVSQTPLAANVFIGQPVIVTATMSGAQTIGQNVYLRYSADNFVTSFVTEMTYTGTTATATIPGTVQTAGTTIRYYVFTSGTVNVATNGANADLYTINLNNGGTNYPYTVIDAYASAQTGNWNTATTWASGALPPVGANVQILNGHNVTLNVNATINSLQVNLGGTFTSSDATARTLSILRTATGTAITNNGAWANGAGAGTVDFRSGVDMVHTIAGTIGFQNVSITRNAAAPNIGVNFGTGSTINGSFQINSGGYVQTNAATYAAGSTLIYATGGTYGRDAEWNVNNPNNVRVINNTILDIRNTTVVARTLTGNLLIEAGSAATMGNMTGALTVGGNVEINGTLTLSSAANGNLNVASNFTNNGTFTGTGRLVTFNGTANQTITGNTTFSTIINSNTTGVVNIPNGTTITIATTGTLNAINTTTSVDGTIINQGVITGLTDPTRGLRFNATGVYNHNVNGNAIPSSTWQVGSTCLITGIVGTTISVAGASVGQNFHHFTWDCPLQTVNINFAGAFTSVNGNLTITNTNTGSITFSGATSPTITIGGNFNLINGTANLTNNTGLPILNVTGNFTQNGGIFNATTSSGTGTFNLTGNFSQTAGRINLGNGSSGTGTLRVAGSFIQSATGIIDELSSSVSHLIEFNGVTPQTVNIAGAIDNRVNFRCNNNNGITLLTNLTINQDATFFRSRGSIAGIINYNTTNSTLSYDGESLTTSDVEWPATTGPINITFNTSDPANIITLNANKNVTTSTSGVLTLTSGKLAMANFNLSVLRANTAAISGGTSDNSYILQNGTGRLTRAIPVIASGTQNYVFPIGTTSGITGISITFTGTNCNTDARNLTVSTNSGTTNMFNPNMPPDYLSRFFTTSLDVTSGNYSYRISSLGYNAGEVTGDINEIKISSFLSNVWTDRVSIAGNPLTSSTGTFTQLTAPLDGGHFSGRNSSALYTWMGTTNSSWATATNWLPNGLPSPTDRVLIDAPGANPILIDDDRTINQLTLTATGTLTIQSTGILRASNLVLDAPAVLTMNSGAELRLTGSVAYTGTPTASLDCNSTVFYEGAGAQTIIPLQYGNLNAVGGNRTFSGTGTIGICGAYTPTIGTTNFAGSTVSFNGSGVQVVPGAHNYASLIIANTNATQVTMGASFSVSNGFTVNTVSYFEIQATRTLTLSGGASVVNGRLRNSQTFNQSGGTLSFGPNSLYEHNITGGNLPSATWDNTAPGATCAVIGWLTSTGAPGNLNPSGGFSNFIWNSTTQTASPNFLGNLQLINRQFLVQNTGSAYIVLSSNQVAPTLTVGTLEIAGGRLRTNNATGFQTLICNSDFLLSAGELDLRGNATAYTYVGGTFNHSGGTIVRNSGTQFIEFNGTVQQSVTFEASAIVSGAVNFRLNNPGGVLVTTGSIFPVNGGAVLQVSQGNVSLQGTASMNYGNLPFLAELLYDPSGSTVITTGDEWPLTDMRRVRINNVSSEPILLNNSRQMSGLNGSILIFDNGRIRLGAHNILILNTEVAAITAGGGYVETDGSGQLLRAILTSAGPHNYVFPVGNGAAYTPLTLRFTANSEPARQVGVRSVDAVHPNMAPNPTDFLNNRYWVTTLSDASGTYTYTPTFGFLAGDIAGSDANVRLSRWNGSSWTNISGSSVAGNTLISGALTQVSGNLANGQWSGRAPKVPEIYTWALGASGLWTTAGNWSPAGVPGSEDEVRFTHNGIFEVTQVPTDIKLARIFFTGGGTTTLLGASAGQVTLGNGANEALRIDAGTAMVVSGNLANNWIIVTGSTGSIAGRMQLRAISGAGTPHTMEAEDNSGLVFSSGSLFEAGVINTTHFIGNPFGQGTIGSVRFAAGSVFEQFDGANPFGSTNVAVFETGSLYRYSENQPATTPSFSGRNFANFEYNSTQTKSVTGGSAFTMDNLTVTQGTFNVNTTGTPGHTIRGNITIANGAALNFNPASITGTVELGGSGVQSISGAGAFSTNNFSTISVNNLGGQVRLQKEISIGGTFAVAAAGTFYAEGEHIVSGTGTFSTVAGSTLGIGSASGITAVGNDVGNIRTTSTRTYAGGANYVYFGTTNQATGLGIPATVTGRIEVANTGGAGNNVVTISRNNQITANLTLTSGLVATALTTNELRISSGGTVNGNGGDLVIGAGAGTLNFNTSGGGSFTGNCNPYNVHISGGVNFGDGTVTIQAGGRFRINSGGGVVSNGPFYAVGSTLQYYVGAQSPPEPGYSRWREWNATSGRGFPHHVVLSNNTQLNPARADNSYVSQAFAIGGNLTIDNGSAIDMDRNGNNMAVPLIIAGDINIEGRLSGSDALEGDVRIAGNWLRQATGQYNPNNRAVTFSGDGNTQTITVNGGGTETFGYFIVDKPNGDVQLTGAPNPNLTNVVVNGTGGNNLQLLRGNIDLYGREFSWGGAGSERLQTDGSLHTIFSSTPAIFRVAGLGNREVFPTNGGTLEFDDQTTVIITSGLDFAPNTTTINATLRIDPNGFANINAPIYGPNGILIYNTGFNYDRRVEWSGAVLGQPGYPNDVIVRNGTTLLAGGPFVAGPPVTGEYVNRIFQARRDVTIEVNSTLHMANTYPMELSLVVGRNLTIHGNLIGSTIPGADIVVGSSWYRSGTFTHNNRAVFFNTNEPGTISNSGGIEPFPYVIVDKAGSADHTLTLQCPLNVSEKFTLTSGRVITDATNILSITNDAPDGPNVGVAVGDLDANPGYVDGPMRRNTRNMSVGQRYLFPVGKRIDNDDFYKRMWLRDLQDDAGNHFFNVEYLRAQPPGSGPYFFQTILKGILRYEYWNVVRETGNLQGRILLPYTNPGDLGWLSEPKTPINPPFNANVAIVRGVPVPTALNNYNWDFTAASQDSILFSNNEPDVQARFYLNDGDVLSRLITEFSPFTIGWGFNSILPLRLLAFTGAIHGPDALLHWTLADAADLKHFEVEHSTNGQQFTRLDNVLPNGGTAFNYRHRNLPKGVHYYRLRMVEKDGRASYSQVVILMVDAQKTIITGLKQNPVVGGQARIGVFSERNQQAEAVILDMTGRTLLRQKIGLQQGYNEPVLSVLPLPAAMYKILLRTDDGVQKVMTMMK